MINIDHFKDLQSWQKARSLTNPIHSLVRTMEFLKDLRLRDVIRDASGPVMHNIVKVLDVEINHEFFRYLKIALRSAYEVQSELDLVLDRKNILEADLKPANDQADEMKRLIKALIDLLRKNSLNWRNRINKG